MPEDGHLCVGPRSPNHPGKECEVKILHEDEWSLDIFYLGEECGREFAVDCTVLDPVFLSENRSSVSIVTEGPECFVGEAVVVSLHFFLSQPKAPQRIVRLVWRHHELAFLVGSFSISTTTAVRQPHATRCLHDRLKRSDHAACGHRPRRAVPFDFRMDIRLTI